VQRCDRHCLQVERRVKSECCLEIVSRGRLCQLAPGTGAVSSALRGVIEELGQYQSRAAFIAVLYKSGTHKSSKEAATLSVTRMLAKSRIYICRASSAKAN
jgi:hypothetical protein